MTDIEDIVPKQTTETDVENAEKMQKLVKDLYHFMQSHSSLPEQKKLFHRELQKRARNTRKSELVKHYRTLINQNELPDDPFFWKLVQKKPVRNTSGVNPITLMYSPYPNGQAFTCRFKCKYCQTHPEYPKSYGP